MATRYKGNQVLQVARATLEALAPPAAQVCARESDDQVESTLCVASAQMRQSVSCL